MKFRCNVQRTIILFHMKLMFGSWEFSTSSQSQPKKKNWVEILSWISLLHEPSQCVKFFTRNHSVSKVRQSSSWDQHLDISDQSSPTANEPVTNIKFDFLLRNFATPRDLEWNFSEVLNVFPRKILLVNFSPDFYVFQFFGNGAKRIVLDSSRRWILW